MENEDDIFIKLSEDEELILNPTIIDFLSCFFGAPNFLFISRNEIKKLIESGGLYINNIRITDKNEKMKDEYLLHGKYVLVRKGKKHIFLIKLN